MSGVLLDTNVISELTKPQRNARVIAFLESLEDGYVSVVTLHELEYGLQRLEEGARRRGLTETIDRFISEYRDRVVPIGVPEARAAAMLRARRSRSGSVLHLADSLIAATALIHGLTLATRNLSDFDGLDISLHNPWS